MPPPARKKVPAKKTAPASATSPRLQKPATRQAKPATPVRRETKQRPAAEDSIVELKNIPTASTPVEIPVSATERPPEPPDPARPPARNEEAHPESRPGPLDFSGFFTRENKLPDIAAPDPDLNPIAEPKQQPSVVTPVAAASVRADLPAVHDPYPVVHSLPRDPTPTPRGIARYRAPDFYRGIYLNNATALSPGRFGAIVRQARQHGLNTLVIDVQPRFPSEREIRMARQAGMYLVARVVVFHLGLDRYPPPAAHLNEVVRAAERAARSGFMEIQLDYIRFADKSERLGVPLAERYRAIGSILKLFTERLRPYGVRIGADIFGRIAFNNDDIIGQKLEIFAPHLDTLYPMLYPSHFYGDRLYQKNPYRAIYDGSRNCLIRVGRQTRVIAYIQAFDMKLAPSGLGLGAYIQAQLKAADDVRAQGYIAWNAANRYEAFFRALRQHRKNP